MFTLPAPDRVLSILPHGTKRSEFWGPTRAAYRLEVAVWNYVCFKVDLRMVVWTSIVSRETP